MKFNLKRKEKESLLSYHESGQGEPLIFIHGLFGELSNWEKTIDYFSLYYRVIVPILPIYDGTVKKEGLEGLVAYVHELVEELQLKSVTLIGNSLGGHVSVLYASAYPERVKRLVLTGSSGLYENTMGSSYPKRNDYKYIEEKVRYTFHNEQIVTRTLVDKVFETVNDLRKSIRVLKIVRAANRHNVSDELQNIKTPTLLIWGEQDRITPIDVAYKFQNLLAGPVDLKVIKNCGHAPMMENPEVFNQLLEEYLNHSNSPVYSEKQAG